MPSGIFIRKPFTEEHKKNISLAKLGWKPAPFSEGHRRKIGESRKKLYDDGILNVKDDLNPRWKGERVGYNALHLWIRKKLGRPNKCTFCGTEDGNSNKFEWANKSGEYKRDLDDWIRLCVRCHRIMDKERRRALKLSTVISEKV